MDTTSAEYTENMQELGRAWKRLRAARKLVRDNRNKQLKASEATRINQEIEQAEYYYAQVYNKFADMGFQASAA